MANPFEQLTARAQAEKQAAAEEKQRQAEQAAAERAEVIRQKTETHDQIVTVLESFGVDNLYRTLHYFREAIEDNTWTRLVFKSYGGGELLFQDRLQEIIGENKKQTLLSGGEWVLERDSKHSVGNDITISYLGIQVLVSAEGISVNGTFVENVEELVSVLEEVELSKRYVCVRTESSERVF